jgi:ribosomal RNA-processing protein 36
LTRKRKRPDSDLTDKRKHRSSSPFYEAEERKLGKKSAIVSSGRSSKHAPTEMSSKRAVSRRRDFLTVPKVQARDPRFSTLSGNLDLNRIKQNYAFLNDYRISEAAELKEQIRATKDPNTKEALKRRLKSMDDRERARKRADEEQAIIREHKKKERERVQQGKKPFFLKKKDVKKQALINRYEALGEKKAEKVMERRRKKKAMRERRSMPSSRRETL